MGALRGGRYVRRGGQGEEEEEETVDLADLKLLCRNAYEIHPMRYDEDGGERVFAYFNNTGRTLRHPTGRPAARE